MTRAIVLVLLACGPSTAPPAKTWTAFELVANAKQDKDFGAISSRKLAVKTGDPIPWRSRPFEFDDSRQGEGSGLPLWPAFADGQTASMLITEIWRDHPTPWVQPVYQFAGRSDLRGLFPVGVKSTFYTPYWRAMLATVPAETTNDTFTSVPALLDANVPLQKSVMVVCPIVPSDTFIAVPPGALNAVRPMSGETVAQLTHSQAWVDGALVDYLGIGFDRQTVTENELPVETPIYFFVKVAGAGKQGYSLPPVLPTDPTRHSLHRRYEVAIPANAGAFVTADRPELARLLRDEGVLVPDADPTILDAVARPYLLRVATNPECFANGANFPASCRWLDSQTALEAAINQDVRARTEVLMTVSTRQVGSP